MARDDAYPIHREAEALIRAAGLHRRERHAALRVTGADRLDYLHRMLTQSVEGLAVGQAAYGCLLNVKGRILGDILLWNADDHLRFEVARDAMPAVRPPLERYVITDDVTFEAIAWGKGCFPGQEPVVMAKHRGRPPRLLVAIDLENETAVERGAEVRIDDATVGSVTAWAPTLAHRPGRALAYVRHGEAVEGRRVQVAGAGPGTVHLLTPAGAAS